VVDVVDMVGVATRTNNFNLLQVSITMYFNSTTLYLENLNKRVSTPNKQLKPNRGK
jgi:hypothetical protein